MSRVLDVSFELMLSIGVELSILSLFLVIVFSIKPFYGRVWLVSSVVFLFLTYIYKGLFSGDFAFINMYFIMADIDESILYRIVFYLFLNNAAKLTFLVFVFLIYFKKSSHIEFEVKDFLFSKKGSVSKKQYWFSMFIILFLVVIPLVQPLFLSFMWGYVNKGYVDGVTMIFSKGFMISALLLSLWCVKNISMRYWRKNI